MMRKFHYAWVVAGVTFCVLLVGAGIRATPGILIVPLEREFGWSNATISAAIAVNIFLYGMVGPFAVAIFERFGLRLTISVTLIVLAAASALSAFMDSTWQLMVLWGVVVGSGTGMIALVLGAVIAGRWFGRHRGLVLGLLTASGAAGQLVFLPFLASLTVNYGWRTVSFAVAVASLILVPFVVLLLRDRPAEMGLPRYGEAHITPEPISTINPAKRAILALGRGVKSRDFWLLSGTFFICGASTNGLIGTHMIPLCIDHGMAEVAAAGMLATMGIFNLIGTTASGWLTDRVDSRKLLAWYYGLRGVSLMFVPYAFEYDLVGLTLFGVFYGLDWIATVPPTVKLAGEAFGEENGPLMFGWISASHQIGAALAAWLAGLARTELGDYHAAFVSAGFLCLAAAMLALLIRSRKSGERVVVVA